MAALLPRLDSTSPAGGFVPVFTPVDHSTSNARDIDGLQLHRWSSEIENTDCHVGSVYHWAVCCCPCLALAQLETRLGLSGFVHAVISHAFSYIGLYGFMVALLLASVSIHNSSQREPYALIMWGLLLICVAAQATFVAHRVASIRTHIRNRFQIPGSVQEDRAVALLQTNRTIRQLATHLQCDNTCLYHAPEPLNRIAVTPVATTLKAYMV